MICSRKQRGSQATWARMPTRTHWHTTIRANGVRIDHPSVHPRRNASYWAWEGRWGNRDGGVRLDWWMLRKRGEGWSYNQSAFQIQSCRDRELDPTTAGWLAGWLARSFSSVASQRPWQQPTSYLAAITVLSSSSSSPSSSSGLRRGGADGSASTIGSRGCMRRTAE